MAAILTIYFTQVACPDFGNECPEPTSGAQGSPSPSFAPAPTPVLAPAPAPAPISDSYKVCTGYWDINGSCSATACGTSGCWGTVYRIPSGSGQCPHADGTTGASSGVCRSCRTSECPTSSGCVKDATHQCGVVCTDPNTSWGYGGTAYGWGCTYDYGSG